MKLKHKQDAISVMIGEAVSMLKLATGAFRDVVLASPKDRREQVTKLSAIEAQADEVYIKLLRKVVDTFITPYDRDDIYRLVESIDDVIDELEHSGILIADLEIQELPIAIQNAAIELHVMSGHIQDAVENLKKHKKFEKALYSINASENTLDGFYRDATIGALKPGTDPLEAIRITVIARNIELTASNLDNLGRALAVTVIKET